jgi:hypothetical protein
MKGNPEMIKPRIAPSDHYFVRLVSSFGNRQKKGLTLFGITVVVIWSEGETTFLTGFHFYGPA